MKIADRLITTAQQELELWESHKLVECSSFDASPGSPKGYEVVAKYWKEGLGDTSRNGCSKYPWSAAFICWCMRQAGIKLDQFPFHGAHHAYIRWAINNAKGGKPGKLYYGRRIGEYSPKPGDLIAQWRKEKKTAPDPKASYDNQPDDFYASHCDLVCRVGEDEAFAIGGNVADKVSESAFVLENGLLKPKKQYICIMELSDMQ